LQQEETGDDSGVKRELLLTQFSIYVRHGLLDELHLMPLHHLQCKQRREVLLLDGVLSYGSFCSYVKGVPFQILLVGGYGKENHSVSDVWIQSQIRSAKNVWYKLGEPSPEYRLYHVPFICQKGVKTNQMLLAYHRYRRY
jgi:hypothetical protein